MVLIKSFYVVIFEKVLFFVEAIPTLQLKHNLHFDLSGKCSGQLPTQS